MTEKTLDSRHPVDGDFAAGNHTKSQVVARLVTEKDHDILDIGCGHGEMARHLSALGKRLIGVDREATCHKTAEPHYEKMIVGDIEDMETLKVLTSLGRRYDLILFSEILEHLVHPEKTLEELRVLLRPHGAIIVVLPNVAFYKTRWMLLLGQWRYREEGILDRTHLNFFTLESAQELLQKAGFRIEDSRFTHYSQRFAFLYDRLTKWWPHLFAEQFVMRAISEKNVTENSRI